MYESPHKGRSTRTYVCVSVRERASAEKRGVGSLSATLRTVCSL